jgi:hypothetical protein
MPPPSAANSPGGNLSTPRASWKNPETKASQSDTQDYVSPDIPRSTHRVIRHKALQKDVSTEYLTKQPIQGDSKCKLPRP